MTEGRIRDVLRSLDGSLDDVRREQAWRGIERAVDSPRVVAATTRRWTWVVPAGVLAMAALAIALWPREHESAPVITTTTTELAAPEGQQTVFDRDGVVLTLVGPGAATIVHGDPAGLRVTVTRGTLVADRRPDAPSLIVSAAGTTTTSRDPRFAVRVQQGMVVFGVGENARAIIERHELELAPTPPPPQPTEPSVEPAIPLPKPNPKPTNPPAAPATAAVPALPPVFPEIKFEASELYARAEAALRVNDPDAARVLLLRVLDEHPGSRLVDPARYDLARIAFAKGDATTAMLYVRRILESGTDPAVRRAAEKLRDRIAREHR
jgi:hypothetical protein